MNLSPAAQSAPLRVDILGTRVSVSSFAEAVHMLSERVERRESAVFSAATVYSVMLGRENPSYRQIVNESDYLMADGMPLVWAARRLGHAAERVHGDDFFLACCDRKRAWRHYLLGGATGQPEVVRRALEARFPGILVAGACATPVRPVPDDEREHIIAQVHACDPDVVWVGMGTPAQDLWMASTREALGRPQVGVGSAFDLLSGRTRRAPDWMMRAGLQWVHRLVQEPRRLTRRYAVYNPLFAWHFGRQLVRERARLRKV